MWDYVPCACARFIMCLVVAIGFVSVLCCDYVVCVFVFVVKDVFKQDACCALCLSLLLKVVVLLQFPDSCRDHVPAKAGEQLLA